MPEPTTSALTPEFRWNPVAGRYIDAAGRFVPQSEIHGVLERVVTASRQEIHSLSLALQKGEIGLTEWRSAMMQELKMLHSASAAEAVGGWAQMGSAEWGRVGGTLRYQYGRLDNFCNEIKYQALPLNGRFLRRADMYGGAARETFAETVRAQREDAGMDEERRVLNTGAEHCGDCVEYAAEGWQPIGTLPRIGDSQCITNCQCYFEYRVSESARQAQEYFSEFY